jgi:hypothetical protein
MSGLWREKSATPNQQRLAFGSRRGRMTQADVLAGLLRERSAQGKALELPEILHTGIAQFTARIFELRKRGFVIENELGRAADGRVLSRYWLRFDPEREGAR